MGRSGRLVNAFGLHLSRELLDELAEVPFHEVHQGGGTWYAPDGSGLGAHDYGTTWSLTRWSEPPSPEGWRGCGWVGSCMAQGKVERTARAVIRAHREELRRFEAPTLFD